MKHLLTTGVLAFGLLALSSGWGHALPLKTEILNPQKKMIGRAHVYIGSAEKHFALIQVTDIIYDSSWSAPTEGSQSASFSSKPLKNLALWCRK